MTRIGFVLFLAVMATAFVLVRTQYESRVLTTEIDRARSEAQRLEVENDRLDVDRRAQATPQRIQRLATEQLHMRTITPAITLYASEHGAAAVGAVGAASAAAPQGGTP